MSTEQTVAALTQTLDGEYAATYAYGLIGAQLTGPAELRARRALDAHRQARDTLRLALAALQAPVPPPAPAYNTGPVDNPAAATQLAIQTEQRLVRNWASVASASGAESRTAAVKSAQECAVRAISWGAQSQAFPG